MVLFLLLLFLVAGFSAVGDLRYQLADAFDVVLGPKANSDAPHPGDGGQWYFLGRDVALKGNQTQTELGSSLAS